MPEPAIEAHDRAAEAFVWASGGALVLMAGAVAFRGRRSSLPIAAAAALATVVVLGLGYRTGQAGGSLVFEHGAAQAYTAGPGSPPAAAQVSEGDGT